MPKGIKGFQKGHPDYTNNKGRKLSEEHKNKLSKANMGKHFSSATEFKKGNVISEEHRNIISKVHKGRVKSLKERQNISKSNKGKKLTEEHRGKLSLAKKKSKKWIGKDNPRWKGGITPENLKIRQSIEYRLWRESVFARDNWVCQKCKVRGGRLHPHHIQNFSQYPELRLAIDNGITFCEKCHIEFHKRYGKTENTNEQIEEFTTNHRR